MPRYFFNVQDHQDLSDHEGTVLPGPGSAREQAVISAGEMLKDYDGKFWQSNEWQMVVTDEQDAMVCTLTVRGTIGEAV